MMKQQTFSGKIKDELSALPFGTACCQQTEIRTAIFAAGRIQGRSATGSPTNLSVTGSLTKLSVTLSTAHPGWGKRLKDMILRQYQKEAQWTAGHGLISLTAGDLPEEALNPPAISALCCRKAALRALFLACGSISKPSLGYHLELSIRNAAAADMAIKLLGGFDILAGLIHRHGSHVVYIHEGQHVADFLLLSGAHLSLLAFESLRVEKEMRNTVNRVVNCDSANTQRIANTAARQLEMIRAISEGPGLGALPQDLRMTAEARLANPDLSLKELGEIMRPPLGKSGMNHRLARLESVAAEMAPKKGGMGRLEP